MDYHHIVVLGFLVFFELTIIKKYFTGPYNIFRLYLINVPACPAAWSTVPEGCAPLSSNIFVNEKLAFSNGRNTC